MTTLRKKLTPNEQMFVSIYFKNIRTDLLNSKQSDFIHSLKTQFEYDGMLSDKQISALRNIKYSSDMATRSRAIAKGKLNSVQNDGERIDQKLNAIFNRIGG